MKALTVVRWKRYGKDRLYVNADDGTRVGWLDLLSGAETLEVTALRAEFDVALAEHRPPTTAAPPPVAPPDERARPEQPWTDYALNRPGEGVRAQAVAEKEAAPIRTLLARVLGVHTDERAWRVGAAGEEKVGAQLAKLPAPWRAIHSIPIGERGSDVDHVAVGPAGVYTINTKHHPDGRIWVGGDTFKVDGHNHPYVRNARYEAKRVGALLSAASGIPVRATGVIAVVGAGGGFNVKAQPADGAVVVVGRRDLRRLLERRAPILDDDQVAALFEAARRSTTWLPS